MNEYANAYDAWKKCSKCGSVVISTLYNPSSGMERKCPRCGYWWVEDPLDKTEQVLQSGKKGSENENNLCY